MKNILVTGGTVFVSKYVAEWFVKRGYRVYVLNRGTRAQAEGVTLIRADRHNLGGALKNYDFDAVLDVCAYTAKDIDDLLDGLGGFGNYIFVSSSAVYPETNAQPFTELQNVGANAVWGKYGRDKIEAERALHSRVPHAYVLRPPYLYGEGQNLYREPFVFDCAGLGRKFYVPERGEMKLQFFHVQDLCRFMEILLEQLPETRIFNVGNTQIVDIGQWVELCYRAAGKRAEKVYVRGSFNQREYFPFHNYSYVLDVTRQNKLMPVQLSLEEGLRREYEWYRAHENQIKKKDYLNYIDKTFRSGGTAENEVGIGIKL